jgi:RNA-directed DNA polymerase
MTAPLRNLANFFEVPPQLLGALIFNTPAFYKELILKKNKGGVRLINIPDQNLRNIQKTIYHKILQKFIAHESAHAYVKGRSIITNAREHLESDYMLKLDILDFFGSVRGDLVKDKFIQIAEVFDRQKSNDPSLPLPSFSDDECNYLEKLCTLNGGLPQGGITSPHLSNLIFYKIDEIIRDHCKNNLIVYTRYSDDMIFSGPNKKVFKVEKYVREILKTYGFCLNFDKMIALNKNDAKYVTGLFVQNGTIRISKSRRREIRQNFHEYSTRDCAEDDQECKAKIKNSLIGKLQFWHYVEPDCEYPIKAIAALKEIQ